MHRLLLGVLLSVAQAGCSSSPCADGFNKSRDGICRAETTCPPGSVRGRDLDCHTRAGSEPPSSDLGDGTVQDTADPAPDTGWATSGPGRIFVRYDGLAGVPSHGFVVMAFPAETGPPSAAFCQIILDDPVDVSGVLVQYDGSSDPCLANGDSHVFDTDEVRLEMMVMGAAGGTAAICDERTLMVSGDQEVDYSAVLRCD